MTPLGQDRVIQYLIRECTNQGITNFEDIWENQDDEHDFRVWANREWWECDGQGEEED